MPIYVRLRMFEEIYIVFSLIESCLKEPLYPLSEDLSDVIALGHFLIGKLLIKLSKHNLKKIINL